MGVGQDAAHSCTRSTKQTRINWEKDDWYHCLVSDGTVIIYPGVRSSFCFETETLSKWILWELQVAVGTKLYRKKCILFPFSTVALQMVKIWISARSLPLKPSLCVLMDLSAPFRWNIFNNCNDSFWFPLGCPALLSPGWVSDCCFVQVTPF